MLSTFFLFGRYTFFFLLNVLCYGVAMDAGHTLLIIFTCTGKGGLPIGWRGGRRFILLMWKDSIGICLELVTSPSINSNYGMCSTIFQCTD